MKFVDAKFRRENIAVIGVEVVKKNNEQRSEVFQGDEQVLDTCTCALTNENACSLLTERRECVFLRRIA